jgi:hypothetical protein
LPGFSVVVEGKPLYDIRDGVTSYAAPGGGGQPRGQNPALAILDYLINTEYGLGASLSEIDTASFIAAANVCDETVALKAGGTEYRYSINGSFPVSQTPEQIIPRLLTSLAGRLTYTNGRFALFAASYITPQITLDETHIVGPVRIQTRLPRRDLFNSVKGVFANPANLYIPSEFPIVSNAGYISVDGEQLWADMDLPFTTSGSMAQRIAKVELERTRQQITVWLTCNMTAYKLRPCDTVMLSLEKYGWSSKVFEVQETALTLDERSMALVINLVLRSTDSTVFSWSSVDEQVVPTSPDTNLSNPWVVGAPGTLAFEEETYVTIDSSGLKTKVRVTWTAPTDFFAQSGLSLYQLDYKKSADSNWITIPATKALSTDIFDMEPGLYNFRIKSISSNGKASDYTSTNYNVIGLSAAPETPTGFSVRPISGVAHLKWDIHPDIDVRMGGTLEARLSLEAMAASDWSDSMYLEVFDGNTNTGIAPLVQGTYLLRALDSGGTYSNSWAAFEATEAILTGYTTVASICEANWTFGGSKTNVVLIGGATLQLSNTAVFSGTYVFPSSTSTYPSGYVDCGSSAPRRLELDLQVTRFSSAGTDYIDNRGNVDDWPSVDGNLVSAGDVIVYVSRTNDNPSGAPTWSPWTPFIVAEFGERAFKFKADFSTPDQATNVGVTAMNVHIKKPA